MTFQTWWALLLFTKESPFEQWGHRAYIFQYLSLHIFATSDTYFYTFASQDVRRWSHYNTWRPAKKLQLRLHWHWTSWAIFLTWNTLSWVRDMELWRVSGTKPSYRGLYDPTIQFCGSTTMVWAQRMFASSECGTTMSRCECKLCMSISEYHFMACFFFFVY